MKACCSSSKPPTFEGGWPWRFARSAEIINFTPPMSAMFSPG